MLFRQVLLYLSLALLSACSSNPGVRSESEANLYKYAYANCLFWYFQERDYDLSDIRSISGGIVETSDISIVKFQAIALFIKDYTPETATKGNIDNGLNRCFMLKESPELRSIINTND